MANWYENVRQQGDRFDVVAFPPDIGKSDDADTFQQCFLIQRRDPAGREHQGAFGVFRKGVIPLGDAAGNLQIDKPVPYPVASGDFTADDA